MGRIPMVGLLVLTLGMVLPACSAVLIQHPAGEPVSKEVGKQVEGWWVAHGKNNDEIQCVLVQSLTDGAIRVGMLELDSSSNKFKLEEWPGLLTQFEGAMYLNVVSEEPKPGESPRYFLLRVRLEDGPAMLVWWSRVSAFEEAVKNGELTGETGRSDVRITATKAELEAYLKSHTPAQVFLSEEPMVFKRP